MLVRDVLLKIALPLLLLSILGLLVLYYEQSAAWKEPRQIPIVDIDTDAAEGEEEQIKPQLFLDSIPDFKRYKSVHRKKSAFFSFMLPMIEHENSRLMNNRLRLISIQSHLEKGKKLSKSDAAWLIAISDTYQLNREELTDLALLDELLIRVDMIPPSLALAQSANESAWGTSRFAREANNLFGQWCFAVDCGIVPNQRPEGASYEVADFKAPMDSVVSYMRNLNSFSAYADFRSMRWDLRAKNLPLSGLDLADGLRSYSTRTDEYIEELRQMIRVNDLAKYDLDTLVF